MLAPVVVGRRMPPAASCWRSDGRAVVPSRTSSYSYLRCRIHRSISSASAWPGGRRSAGCRMPRVPGAAAVLRQSAGQRVKYRRSGMPFVRLRVVPVHVLVEPVEGRLDRWAPVDVRDPGAEVAAISVPSHVLIVTTSAPSVRMVAMLVASAFGSVTHVSRYCFAVQITARVTPRLPDVDLIEPGPWTCPHRTPRRFGRGPRLVLSSMEPSALNPSVLRKSLSRPPKPEIRRT